MPEIHVTLLGRFAVTVGGVPVAEAGWKRRHAAAVVKVLALAPGRRLHREQVIDLVLAGGHDRRAVPKLHKAAHFARRALGVPDAVVLRGDQVPDPAAASVDVVGFEELPAEHSPTGMPPWPAGAALTTASCCPATGTRSGPSRAATSSASVTWTCCAWTAAGRRGPARPGRRVRGPHPDAAAGGER